MEGGRGREMLAELSISHVRDSRVWFPLALDLNVSLDLYSRFLLVLPDLLGPYKDMNTFMLVFSQIYRMLPE